MVNEVTVLPKTPTLYWKIGRSTMSTQLRTAGKFGDGVCWTVSGMLLHVFFLNHFGYVSDEIVGTVRIYKYACIVYIPLVSFETVW